MTSFPSLTGKDLLLALSKAGFSLVRVKGSHHFGIKAFDALHIAYAEQGGADVFLSTDDRLVKVAKRNSEAINIRVENPLEALLLVFLAA